jgi:hypothetical protein
MILVTALTMVSIHFHKVQILQSVQGDNCVQISQIQVSHVNRNSICSKQQLHRERHSISILFHRMQIFESVRVASHFQRLWIQVTCNDRNSICPKQQVQIEYQSISNNSHKMHILQSVQGEGEYYTVSKNHSSFSWPLLEQSFWACHPATALAMATSVYPLLPNSVRFPSARSLSRETGVLVPRRAPPQHALIPPFPKSPMYIPPPFSHKIHIQDRALP